VSDDCIFCAIAKGEGPATIVAQDDHTVAFMDIMPATRGHMLVIPRAHYTDLLSVDADALSATVQAAKAMAERVKVRLGADGVNLLNSCGRAAWQTVFHFHVHVIPRYDDDPLTLPWIPREGDMDEIQRTGALLAD
jgi:histidine triad (HIT) family protein